MCCFKPKDQFNFFHALSNLKGSFEFQVYARNFTKLFHSQYFHGVNIKLQQSMHFHWMYTCQKFHLIQRYKRGISNKFIVMHFRPIAYVTVVFKRHYVLNESYVQKI